MTTEVVHVVSTQRGVQYTERRSPVLYDWLTGGGGRNDL